MKAFGHRQKKSAHFQKWNMSRNTFSDCMHIKFNKKLWPPYSGGRQPTSETSQEKKKTWKWNLICQESPGQKVATLQNWWPQWKWCLVKDGDHEGWVQDAQVSLRKVTILIAVIYHKDRVCIKSEKTKDLWGEFHEKLGANCRCSHPVESQMHLILPKVTPDTASEVPARECTLASEHRTFIESWSVSNTFKV